MQETWYSLGLNNPLQTIALLVILGVAGFASAVFFAWQREQRHRRTRRMVRAIHRLGDDLTGLTSLSEVASEVWAIAPKVFRVSEVVLYFYNRNNRALERFEKDGGRLRKPVVIDAPEDFVAAGAVAAFLNRTVFAIPDTRQSPYRLGPPQQGPTPRGLLFAPMLNQNEVAGVLQLSDFDKPRFFRYTEQSLAQHLARQIALANRLIEQQSIGAQLSRSEKLAAMGQLISGVVSDLEAPLAAIDRTIGRALLSGNAGEDLKAILAEAERAREVAHRLVSFAQPEQRAVTEIDLTKLLDGLIRFREREWRARNVQVNDQIGGEPLIISGSRGQIEKAFLSLLLFAEQAAGAGNRTIELSANTFARRILIGITFPAAEPVQADSFASVTADPEALNLKVCRTIFTNHGGDLRYTRERAGRGELHVELPAARFRAASNPSRRPEGLPARQLTAILVEPDEVIQRHVIAALSSRSIRVVAVQSASEAVEIVQRFHFDLALCSLATSGMNWVELRERISEYVDAFIHLADPYHSGSAGEAPAGSRAAINPLEGDQLLRAVDDFEARMAAAE